MAKRSLLKIVLLFSMLHYKLIGTKSTVKAGNQGRLLRVSGLHKPCRSGATGQGKRGRRVLNGVLL
jgi:hypothetical protein